MNTPRRLLSEAILEKAALDTSTRYSSVPMDSMVLADGLLDLTVLEKAANSEASSAGGGATA